VWNEIIDRHVLLDHMVNDDFPRGEPRLRYGDRADD
jgi:hypothetical protein